MEQIGFLWSGELGCSPVGPTPVTAQTLSEGFAVVSFYILSCLIWILRLNDWPAGVSSHLPAVWWRQVRFPEVSNSLKEKNLSLEIRGISAPSCCSMFPRKWLTPIFFMWNHNEVNRRLLAQPFPSLARAQLTTQIPKAKPSDSCLPSSGLAVLLYQWPSSE